MKNIFTILSLVKIKDQIKNVFSRFPISVIFILVFSGLLLSLLHVDISNITEKNIVRWALSSMIWFFFSLSMYLYSESKEDSNLKKLLFQIIPVWYSLLYFFSFKNNFESLESMIFFALSMVAIAWFLFFAPYIKNIIQKNGKQSVYYTYFYNISVIILTSFILGWILFALWAIWITAIHELFDLSGYFRNEIYWDWAIIALAIIPPLFALTKIPKKREFTNNYFNENAFFSFLIKYIAIPFIYLYFIILYAYSAKVLMNFSEWPKGEVSWMVIGFSIFWYLTYIFSYIFEEKNKFIKTFRKYFPCAVIPQIFMLFYAIYLRIAQYDITINRYFVVIFWIWLLSISLYYIFSKKKYLGNLTVLLTLFTIIISVGPWSVYSLPETRQLERLKNNLIKANILQWNTIIPLNNYNDIDQELSKNIYSWIDYVCNFNSCEKIKELFPEITKQVNDKFQSDREINIKNNPDNDYYKRKKIPNSWEYVNKITETIKVKRYYYNEDVTQRATIYLNSKNHWIYPLDVTDGKILYQVIDYGNDEKSIKATFNETNNYIEFYKQETKIFELNFTELSKTLYDAYIKNWDNDLNNQDLIIDVSNDTWKYKLFLNSIVIKNPKYIWEDKNYYFNLNGLLLEK
jgi:hypothetical protein